ncbi:ABC transporter ATP-binding protein [Bacteroidia bacterium]|jgi:putative ABC transport system ATP-binding protein|nr:ABC transporter ATP-binding protein [Bacteroidia bacterium]MDC0560935.1 ABC transporter ATP-binding protein [Bacteroidia bacterium]
MISIKNIHMTYQSGDIKVQALQNIDLTINPGEFTAIVGPSGSGKTTLLNIIGGLDSPTKGSVKINDTDITQLPENELIDFRLHHIGFIFQSYNLIPVLTAKENVEFLMLLQNREEEFRNERTLKLLKAVGLEDQIHKRPNEMSGGQQQRVAVARALASKPNFILADEPTANLDSKSSENLLSIMQKLNKNEKTTFIFSTHDQRVIDKANRIVTIEDGKIISDTSQ